MYCGTELLWNGAIPHCPETTETANRGDNCVLVTSKISDFWNPHAGRRHERGEGQPAGRRPGNSAVHSDFRTKWRSRFRRPLAITSVKSKLRLSGQSSVKDERDGGDTHAPVRYAGTPPFRFDVTDLSTLRCGDVGYSPTPALLIPPRLPMWCFCQSSDDDISLLGADRWGCARASSFSPNAWMDPHLASPSSRRQP